MHNTPILRTPYKRLHGLVEGSYEHGTEVPQVDEKFWSSSTTGGLSLRALLNGVS
jgi:hypothetical protein